MALLSEFMVGKELPTEAGTITVSPGQVRELNVRRARYERLMSKFREFLDLRDKINSLVKKNDALRAVFEAGKETDLADIYGKIMDNSDAIDHLRKKLRKIERVWPGKTLSDAVKKARKSYQGFTVAPRG